jgi:thiamine-monophosphate kinase
MSVLDTIGETALIERLTACLPQGRDVVVGPGDDCAVVRAGDEDWLLTSDPVIEGVHFTPDADPVQIGHKAVARALSDIAAMGGLPRWALVDLVAPADMPSSRLEAIYDGIAATAARYGLTIVGGDVARGPALELHLFAVGSLPRGSAILRSGAIAGDAIYVTGALGGSHTAGRHLTFEPRLREGQWLREGGWTTAMCDISDGLATDLHHLCKASHVGGALRLPTIPLTEAAQTTDDPLERALTDGEDFELLFTVPPDRQADLADAWSGVFGLACNRIGTIIEELGVWGIDADNTEHAIPPGGFDHFATDRGQP